MDVQRLSRNFASKIEENLRPISTHILPFTKQKNEIDNKNLADLPNFMKKIDIENAYKMLKQNANMNNKANIKIITCLKSAQKCWEQYANSSNKNGQIACSFEIKFKRIEQKLQQQLSKLIVHGQLQKVKQVSELLKPMIDYLQKKSRKYKQHENEFKIKSRKMEQQQKQNEQKDDEIKQQMIDLVQKFKQYALNINENLNNDTTIIKQIGKSQDKQLSSLQNKNTSMQEIIKQQKLGFFQLIGMGIFAVVIWVIGLMVILII